MTSLRGHFTFLPASSEPASEGFWVPSGIFSGCFSIALEWFYGYLDDISKLFTVRGRHSYHVSRRSKRNFHVMAGVQRPSKAGFIAYIMLLNALEGLQF